MLEEVTNSLVFDPLNDSNRHVERQGAARHGLAALLRADNQPYLPVLYISLPAIGGEANVTFCYKKRVTKK